MFAEQTSRLLIRDNKNLSTWLPHHAGCLKMENNFFVSTDKSKLDIKLIHNFLRRSYWAKDITLKTVEDSIKNSLCLGIYQEDRQVGFARVITDYATFAYLADVFILENYQGRGLARLMLEFISDHPKLQNLRRWMLATKDAHGLYSKYGFKKLENPDHFMTRARPGTI